MADPLSRTLARQDIINALGYDPEGDLSVSGLNVADTDELAAPWTAVAGAVSSSVGTIGTASANIRTKKVGRTVFLQGVVSITTYTNASGALNVVLPYSSASDGALSGTDAVGRALSVRLTATSSSATITYFDGSFPGAAGTTLRISGVYESVL